MNIVPLLVIAVFGLLASDVVSKEGLEQGKVRINHEVVAARESVDYSKMND